MKTSVVLSSHNGEEYIQEQLESIRVQSVPINEVIIIDDCSSDNTVKICYDFIQKYQLINWSLEINNKKKGFVSNFHRGFEKATGDIIFICDQDDIWRINKVERTKFYFNKYPNALSICSAFSRFWKNKVIDKHVDTPNRLRGGIKRIGFSEFCQFHWYLGMTTAFKKELLQYHYKECISLIPYDISVNFVAVLNNGLFYVDEVLVNRRSYNSTSNKIATEWKNKQFNGNSLLYNIYRHNLNLNGFKYIIDKYNNNESLIQIVDEYICINNIRKNYIENKSIISWAQSCTTFLKLYSFSKYIKDGLSFLKMGNGKFLLVIKHLMDVVYLSIYDGFSFIKFTEVLNKKEDEVSRMKFFLTVGAHSLEKGLSYPIKKEKFGEMKAISLLTTLSDYLRKDYPQCDFSVYETIAIIKEYLSYKEKIGEKNIEIELLYNKCLKLIKSTSNYCTAGIDVIKKVDLLCSQNDAIKSLFQNTRSIRNYDKTKQVTEEEIKSAISLSKMAPSACNRQPVRVYYTMDKIKNETIGKLVPGNKGFEDEVPNYLVVTSAKNFFGLFEYNQWYVNGGIFLGYLRLALHTINLGSCIFQWSLHTKEKELRLICGIPKRESIIAIVGIGHYAENSYCIRAQRKSVEEYLIKF